jgi:hypothetical protein
MNYFCQRLKLPIRVINQGRNLFLFQPGGTDSAPPSQRSHLRFPRGYISVIHAILSYKSTTVNFLVLVVLIFSQNFCTNGPFVVLSFCKVSDTMVLIFAKKSYTAGKFMEKLKNLHLVKRSGNLA